MKLTNSLTRKVEDLKPLGGGSIGLYSCGPTVYDRVHIGNFRAFIVADTLARTLRAAGFTVKHVMNLTDIDDKTIKRGQQEFAKLEPKQALRELTAKYTGLFIEDARRLNIDLSSYQLTAATDHIAAMADYIAQILKNGYAYIGEDGVYFDIKKYTGAHPYGLLAHIDLKGGRSRVKSDDYDKESAADFALWKQAKKGEPDWEATFKGQPLPGRPGWHIECSVMSTLELGQPFDIHTGGVDLRFPHHENEIAQTRAHSGAELAQLFLHNEFLLVEGRKMSKSLNNFLTLEDILAKGYDPRAFRVLVLQSHYLSQQNFTWEALSAAQNFLHNLYAMADRQFQPAGEGSESELFSHLKSFYDRILAALEDDLDTPATISVLAELANYIDRTHMGAEQIEIFTNTLKFIDAALGLGLSDRQDISREQKLSIKKRDEARKAGDFAAADQIRLELEQQKIGLHDTAGRSYWYRLA